ncbi:MAG: helix-turn-helix transcriptional regulator, partial [Bacteroidales bacterium]|nr:helix-turn-helix transcriptional regulator [Bacteroidales bacterium]
CCRYWWMAEWKSQQMSFPYWRMYWNQSGRAWIVYNKTIALEPDKLILIPPNTPFASDIDGTDTEINQPYSLKGGRVESRKMETEMVDDGIVLHLFIHFTLGYPFDTITPDIFVFDITGEQRKLIHSITDQLIEGRVKFEQAGSLELYSLLFSLLQQIPAEAWRKRILDFRVIDGIRHMEKNIHMINIQNSSLAEMGGMSVNAYARLFKEQTGYSPRKYLLRMRIEKSCNMLHHSDLSIEQIASSCGFSDRYYFTRIFTRTMKIPPGVYRRNSVLGES